MHEPGKVSLTAAQAHGYHRFRAAGRLVLVTAVALGAAGCKSDQPSAPPGSQTDCGAPVDFVANAPIYQTYYDFLARACVLPQPDTQSRLSDYSILEYLAKHGDAPVVADMTFTSAMPPPDFQLAMRGLQDAPVSLMGVHISVDATTVYTGIAILPERAIASVLSDLEDDARAAFLPLVVDGAYPAGFADVIANAITAGDYQVRNLTVTAAPSQFLDTWHLTRDLIRRINPLTNIQRHAIAQTLPGSCTTRAGGH